ncbi:MAG TPA: hypothetical protein VJH92_05905 [Candidatus Nanoarchaeia archaeon]|nr:hypothetical protein [Candidatus Nanoarchaeia archaeon]
MEDRLKQVFGRTDTFLDFHSVIDGFRDVGLIGLIEYNREYNENEGTSISAFEEQLNFIRNYLSHKSASHELIYGWGHLYFLAKKNKTGGVNELLAEYQVPIESREGGRKLGLILGFPECCVKAHYNGEDIGKRGFNVLPFASCKPSCEKPWREEYARLANLYGVDITKEHLNNNINALNI